MSNAGSMVGTCDEVMTDTGRLPCVRSRRSGLHGTSDTLSVEAARAATSAGSGPTA